MHKVLGIVIGITFLLTNCIQAGSFESLDSTYRAGRMARRPAPELQQLLDQMEAVKGTAMEEGIYFFNKAGFVNAYQNDLESARFYYYKAKGIFDGLEEEEALKKGLECLRGTATLDLRQGMYESGIAQANELLEPYRKLKDTVHLMATLNLCYVGNSYLGNYDLAQVAIEEALTMAYAVRDTAGISLLLGNASLLCYRRGDYKESLKILEEQRLYMDVSNSRGYTVYLKQLGRLYFSTDDLLASREALEEGLVLAMDNQFVDLEVDIRHSFGLLNVREEDTLQAIEDFSKSLALAQQTGNLHFTATNKLNIGQLYHGSEVSDVSERYLREAKILFEQMQDVHGQSVCAYELGKVMRRRGHLEAAIQSLLLADSLGAVISDWGRIQFANEELASVYEEVGNAEVALNHYKRMVVAKDTQDLLAAKIYADSLKATQVEENVIQEKPVEESGIHPLLWTVVGLVLVGAIIVIWKYPRQKNVEVEGASEETLRALMEKGDWATFMMQFEGTYPGLLQQVGQANEGLSPNDFRILAMARLGLSNAEMAELMGITPDSSKKARQRTRKKLGLEKEVGLQKFLIEFAK